MTARITWILHNGREVTADVPDGLSLMEASVANGVPIAAECGGACACATCHLIVQNPEFDLPPPSLIENDMLDFVETEREAGSRLSCQIRTSACLDGLRLKVP